MKFYPSDRVKHDRFGLSVRNPAGDCPPVCSVEDYGFGVVLEEWGTIRACKHCYADESHCECAEFHWIMVSGAGVYDVLWQDGKCRPVNKDWLQKMRVKERGFILK